jgi:hypothetical protein
MGLIQKGIPFILLLLLLIVPAAAITIPAENVGSYSIVADPGTVIYKIVVNDLPIGTSQTHTLIYQGQPFLLTITTWTDWGIYRNAKIDLTMPNGSVQSTTVANTGIGGNYKTTIQPTFRADGSVLNALPVPSLRIDLDIGLTPVSAKFGTGTMNYNPSTSIPFTAASGSFSNGQTSTVYAYQVTTKEFQETIVKYNPLGGIEDLGNSVFQWTWNAVLGFISMIPVIGPIMVEFIGILGTVLAEMLYWIVFIVLNIPAIILSIEVIIMIMAVINAGKGKRSFGRLMKNLYAYNVATVTGFIWLMDVTWRWLHTAIDTVTNIVRGLKPLG